MPEKKGTLTVALVRGPIVYWEKALNSEATPAIALAYIAAYLRKLGHDVVLVDATGEGLNKIWDVDRYPGFKCQGLNFEETIALIPPDTDVVGFSGMFSGEWPVLRDLISMTRARFPRALFVAGGEHVTALPEYCLRDCPALDACVLGEGERTFAELLAAYASGRDFSEIGGVCFLDKSGVPRRGAQSRARIPDWKEIPWPYWPDNYLEKFWATGKSYGVATERDMPFMFSRGCPYQCTFCSSPLMWTTRYVLRDVGDVIDEIKHYVSRYKITSIQVYDLTAVVRRSWLVDFCRRLEEEGIRIRWSLPSGTRSEALDKETIALMKRTGCNYLVYAPESGSARTLESVKKRIKLAKITESILETKRQKLTARINLIIAFPDETWRDVFQTLLYGLKMSAKGVDEVPIFIFSPHPGTEIFKSLLDSGRIRLSDEYFLSLNSLNSAYLSTRVVSYNDKMAARPLGIVRLTFILTNYLVGYVFYPSRILRSLHNVLSEEEAATVMEHRFKDFLRRKKLFKARV